MMGHNVIFPPLQYTLNRLGDTDKIVSRKSKRFSAKKLTPPTTGDNSLSPQIKRYINSKFCLVIKGSSLKKENTTYTLPDRIGFCFL